MGDYHDIYLQLDVVLLADFFEKFRRTCMEFYKLDPLHYFTTPSLVWDSAICMSRVDLELITNENMIENSIRGDISMISTCHAKANNPSRLLDNDEIESLILEDLDDEAEDGYIYEVDLHYPIELHSIQHLKQKSPWVF